MRVNVVVRPLVSSLVGVIAAMGITACSAEEPTTMTETVAPSTAPTTAASASASPAVVPAPATTTKPAPRPTTTTAKKHAKTTSVYGCEPTANAKFEDPAHPNIITNKSCPALNAAKEKAQRQYAE